jgi:hypothetical protein
MAFFEDLTEYSYARFSDPRTKNVGWLARGHEFKQKRPTEALLDLIWNYCTISVEQMRGMHVCEFCPRHKYALPAHLIAERKGRKLLLGSAEIRVFSNRGDVYAAPNLIYHYASAHNYSPPDEFVAAMREGPKPPNHKFFERLSQLGLDWRQTEEPTPEDQRGFRFEKTENGIKIIPV